MPILKVPVHYNFGIVSHDEHKKLHQRLVTQYLEKAAADFKRRPRRNPFELTEEFIENFNNASKTERKEAFIDLAKKMLIRCKRRLGLNVLGCAKYVNIPVAWTEAIMLSQCKGEISEEALEILGMSLDHAPIAPEHISILFFIAECILYKLCYDAAQKPYLFSCEIKLLKLGFLVFLRLFLLCLFGYQRFSKEHKSRLHTGLRALAECEMCYQLYPNILFMVQFMLKAGEIICETAVVSESQLESQENFEEMKEKARHDTTSTTASSAAELNSKQKQFRIKPFLWHSLLVWVCVHNSSSQIDAVLMHVLFYKEQLHQKNWLESVLALMVLGESAKLNMSCLKILMDLMKYFISSSMPLLKQEKNNKKKMSCWHWQIGYIYTNILKEICLHGINADLQKTAFLGFCDCGKEHNDKELRGTNFSDLLNFCLPSDDYNDPFWVIRYGVIYNLVILRSELLGDVNREGLRNAVWRILQKQKGAEKDSRVLDAAKVAQVEAKGQINTSFSLKDPSNSTYLLSSQCIGWRVTTALCHHFLPPIGPNIPLSHLPERKPVLLPHQKLERVVTEKKTKRLSLREELLQAGVPKYPYPDYLTRTDMELRRIINAQWRRELQIRLQLEEKLQELERQAKQKLEDEHFRQIMIWRFEKLHKTTKPYELPFKHEDTKATEASSSTQLSNV
ncbi:PREDICTED: transmembrane protein 232 [Thamnophis sirtalis]|uniref:Transmembrane protein 232 n=1 Tax=Thamnophis sirtalis TaxID=35019 RepID=A0A6I9XLV7_9SAUR|nr:PREDICTED: transmembrane protein 232 [Thamnophis sirtalis]XP_013914931.1 PREDICTED: transmembrane protein 232 [Thamnophis sirtalis]